MTPARESNKGDTSGACLMIFSFRLFQLGYLAVISAESVSHFILQLSSLVGVNFSFFLPVCLLLSDSLLGCLAFWLLRFLPLSLQQADVKKFESAFTLHAGYIKLY